VPSDCPTLAREARRQRQAREETRETLAQAERTRQACRDARQQHIDVQQRHIHEAIEQAKRDAILAEGRAAVKVARAEQLAADRAAHHAEQARAREAQAGAALVRRLSRKFGLPGGTR
jgi:hypothetical protein